MAFELVPFRPFSDLPSLWDDFFETPHFHFGGFDFGVPMEINETKNSVVVEAEMPGMDSKSLDISLNGDLLTIRGEKKQETKTDNGDCYCTERIYGKFSRSVRLPGHVKSKADEIKATYKDGVLRIEIPKAEAKTIKIATS
jgi:HSP20 family protein